MYCNGNRQEFEVKSSRYFCPVCHKPFRGKDVSSTDGSAKKTPFHSRLEKGPVAVLCQRSQHSKCRDFNCCCPCHWGGEIPKPVGTVEVVEKTIDLNAETLAAVKVAQEIVQQAHAEAQDFHRKTADIVTGFQNQLAAMETAREIVVKSADGKKAIKVGAQHQEFEKLLRWTNLNKNMFMRGAAGSGKTSAVAAIAKALGLPFYAISLGPQTSKSDLVGYMDATGKYVPTLLRKAFENGGVILFDEIDAANAAVLTIINAILSAKVGDFVGFGDKMVARHADCRFLAAGNTYGKGADALYVGRAQLDAATINRWNFLNWDYDWNFVSALSGNSAWTRYIEELFNRASELKIRVVIGPREAIDGADALAHGFDIDEVESIRIWNAIPADDKAKIMAGRKSFAQRMAQPEPPKSEEREEKPEPHDEERDADYDATTPTSCPKCGGTSIDDNRELNYKRRAMLRTPLPDFKCRTCDKWRVWPKSYNWDTKEWTS